MIESQINQAVHSNSEVYGIPPSLLQAIIDVESARYPYIPRLEPHLRSCGWVKRLCEERDLDITDDRVLCSYGPMQILYVTAAHYGFDKEPELLNAPRFGINYACRYIADLRKQHKKSDLRFVHVISSYNQGGPYYEDVNGNGKFDPERGERYKNQDYVNKVIRRYRHYLAEQGLISKWEDIFGLFVPRDI